MIGNTGKNWSDKKKEKQRKERGLHIGVHLVIWVSDVIGGNRKKRKPPGILIRENMWPGDGRILICVSIRYQNPPATDNRGIMQMIRNFNPNGSYSIGKDGGFNYTRHT